MKTKALSLILLMTSLSSPGRANPMNPLSQFDLSPLCDKSSAQKTQSQVQGLQNIIAAVPNKTVPVARERSPQRRQVFSGGAIGANAVCSGYINANGSVGAKGQRFVELFNSSAGREVYEKHLLSDAAGDKAGMISMKVNGKMEAGICPRWKELTREQRIQFWVWSFAAISKKESTCGTNPQSEYAKRDVTGLLGIGEFQLNYSKKHRSWRGARLGLANCKADSVAGFRSNAGCALDTMADQFAGIYSKNGRYEIGLIGNSYWAELKTNIRSSRKVTSPILRDIRKFPPCQ